MGARHLVGQKELPTTIQVVSVNRYINGWILQKRAAGDNGWF
jgi:hypothetical protein